MIKGKKVVVVMPAYNASETLEKTYNEIPLEVVDEVVLVDDCSIDQTIETAKKVGIKHIHRHDVNKGYGGNQKTCYQEALALGADIVIMVHPDYQYTPKLIPAMSSMIEQGLFDCVLASRILGTGALKGGMPLIKFVANRALTFFENIMVGHKLSEYHTGYRAFSREILEMIDFSNNSDDFVFDNQMLLQIIGKDFRIGEVTCPTKYMDEASSIGGWKLYKYGLGVIQQSILFRLNKWGLIKSKVYS